MNISKFEEKKYYVMTSGGQKWSDFDGPFDTLQEGREFLKALCDGAAPEIINTSVLTYFENGHLNFAREYGKRVDGKTLYWEIANAC